ncbi:TetR/AcrR family transcriptional regulator [Ideonella sp.]|uniref:TetR/AcrR family transcriptional regulator n=1 Tax=Ideonella sp. TaxID=1929293 RepID=UPI003BB7EB51
MPAAFIAQPPPTTPQALIRTRLRLSPEERIPQILDAAMAEFSAHGYTATRMDDIAGRAGLSKGGLYAHFASKEAVFDALIQRSLGMPALAVDEVLAAASDLNAVLDGLFHPLYAQLTSPAALATARLILTEGPRLPAGAVHWRESSLSALVEQLGEVLRRCALRGWCRDSILLREPWLLISPLVHLMARQVACEPIADAELQAAQAAHLAMLRDLLAPASPAAPA